MRGFWHTRATGAWLAATLTLPCAGASAQGIFDLLLGTPPQRSAPPPPIQPLPPPPPSVLPRQSMPSPGNVDQAIGNSSVGGGSYCVRMCDGRYFPLERHANASPTQLCSLLCPGSATKIYSGAEIARSIAADGSRYGDLKTAYLYRKTLVSGCTCNGHDTFGLAPIDVKNDPTLRPGDTVARDNGAIVVGRP